MRAIFVSAILIALCSSANAAKVHHANPHGFSPRDAVMRPDRDQAIPPGWYKFPGYPPIPPEDNRNLDPSNYGHA
jgi:hypothetical protein